MEKPKLPLCFIYTNVLAVLGSTCNCVGSFWVIMYITLGIKIVKECTKSSEYEVAFMGRLC